jgi:hypothetical protein
MVAKRPKLMRGMRFSLFALMLLMTCVCGYLGGYREGYTAADSTWHYGATYAKTYNVIDLVPPIPDFNGLGRARPDFCQLLWILEDAKLGQPADESQIRPFEPNLCLVVNANGIVHRRVHNLLEELRRGRLTQTRVN